MLNFWANYHKYGAAPTSHDLLKFAALVVMVIDHLYLLFPDILAVRAIGRIGTPAWFFLCGFARPTAFRYELVFYGILLLAVDWALDNNTLPINVLFSIIIARSYIQLIERFPPNRYELLAHVVFLLLFVPISQPFWEYGTLGCLFALLGYYHRLSPQSHTSIFLTLTAGIAFITSQLHLFTEPWHIALMILGTFCFLIAIYFFKLIHFKNWVHHPVANVINFCARNTLYLYVGHLILLLIASHMLYPK